MQVRVQKTIQGFREGLLSEEAVLERLQDWLNTSDEALRTDAIEALVVVGTSAAARLLADFLGLCAWRDNKLDAIRALGKFKGEEDLLPVLARWAFSDDIEVGQEALLALGGLGLKGAVEVLLHVLDREPPQKKLQAIYSLGKLGSPRAVARLLAELEPGGRDNPLLAETLLLCLTDLRARPAVDAMREYARSVVPGVRHAAITGLGKVALPNEGVEKLLAPLTEDADVLTSSLAQWALSSVRARGRKEPAELLEEALTEPEPLLRLPLVRDLRLLSQRPLLEGLAERRLPPRERLGLLYELETSEAVSAMADVLAGSKDAECRLEAARLLSHVGPPAGCAARLGDVASGPPGLRGLLAVARALSAEGPALSALLAPPSLAGLEAPDVVWVFRAAGRLAAAHWRDPAARASLVEALTRTLERERSPAVLAPALELLRHAAGGGACPEGFRALASREDVPPEWRWRALASLNTPDSARQLSEAFAVEEAPDRLAVLLRLLSEASAPIRLDAGKLASVLARADGPLAEACLGAIGRLRPEGALGLLEPFLRSDDYRLQRAAVIAVGELGDGAAVPLLASLLDSPDRRIQGRTIHALSQLGGDGATVALLEFLARHPWDEEFGDKVLRSVSAPAHGRVVEVVALLEGYEERVVSASLRERANRFKLAVLVAATPRERPPDVARSRVERMARERLGMDPARAPEAVLAMARAEALVEGSAAAPAGDPAVLHAVLEACMALDAACERALAAPFQRMRQERVVYTVLENIGFAGTRSNAIDRSFFLELLHGLPVIRELSRFPDEVLRDILEILYKNQLHREFLLHGSKRWALIMLTFGREYWLERFRIPNLLGLPAGADQATLLACRDLIALDDRKTAMTARIARLSREDVCRFVDAAAEALRSLAVVFGWGA